MLALSRKKNEAIVINNDIEITVLEVKGEDGLTALHGTDLTDAL